jgi:hypothetical protein
MLQLLLAGLLARSILNAFPLIKLHKHQQWRGDSKTEISAVGNRQKNQTAIADSR